MLHGSLLLYSGLIFGMGREGARKNFNAVLDSIYVNHPLIVVGRHLGVPGT
jgi:hypothetical protein